MNKEKVGDKKEGFAATEKVLYLTKSKIIKRNPFHLEKAIPFPCTSHITEQR